MARPDAGSASAKLLTLVTILVAVAGLYIGREVLIPLALAILLSFLLAPLVRRLERLGLWRLPSVLLAAILALAAVVVITYVMGGQLILLGDRLPQYRYSIHERMAAIRSGDSALGRAGRNIQEISKEFATSQTGGRDTRYGRRTGTSHSPRLGRCHLRSLGAARSRASGRLALSTT